MNPNAPSCRTLAFTLVEMLVVIAIIGILAALLLPVLDKSEGRAKRIVCINNLEQIGLAFHTFSNDHNGKFPMAISTNDGGSMEYVQSGFEAGNLFYTTFYHFQTLSNELVSPQTLVCPADTRVATNNFASLQNANLSYFIGVQSTFDKPTTVLAGDRNLVSSSNVQTTIVQLGGIQVGWDWQLHQFKGDVLLADGHVEQWTPHLLLEAQSTTPFIQSLFLPTVPGAEWQYANGPSAPDGSSSGGSAAAPSSPNAPASAPWQPSFGQAPAENAASSSSQSPSSPAGQPMQSLSQSSGDQLYATEIVSQAQPDQTLVAVRVPASPPPDGTDVVISVADENVGMSHFDRHMTMVMQNSLLWLYIVICILVLLYLLYRMQKRRWRRHARRGPDFRNSGD